MVFGVGGGGDGEEASVLVAEAATAAAVMAAAAAPPPERLEVGVREGVGLGGKLGLLLLLEEVDATEVSLLRERLGLAGEAETEFAGLCVGRVWDWEKGRGV